MNLKKRARTDAIVIHCTASTPKMNIGAHEIDQWHRKRGWVKIGYHFVIRRDGTVEIGRNVDEVGSHAAGHNSTSVAICLVGGLDLQLKPANNFTPEQWASLARLVHNLKAEYPDAEVLGHRDLPGVRKECPCFDVKSWLQTI